MTPKLKHISWDGIDRSIDVIVNQIKVTTPPTFIGSVFGFPRGGLIPAVMLSHRLGVPLVSYPLLDSLLVDDIYDTGYTVRPYFGIFSKIFVLFTKESLSDPDSFLSQGKYNAVHSGVLSDWLVFPWEDENRAILEYEDYLQRRPGYDQKQSQQNEDESY